jgi:hypothetical protein
MMPDDALCPSDPRPREPRPRAVRATRRFAAVRVAGCICLASALLGCVARSEGHTEGSQPASGAGGTGKAGCKVHGRVKTDATFTKACSPYTQPSGGIDIIDGATLTIEAGVEIRFSDGDWLEVGAAGEPGRLIAKGTAEDPIVLTTSSPETPRTWLGVWFHSGTLPGSELSHAVVRHAGGENKHSKPNLTQGCVTLTGVKSGALTLSDLQVDDCDYGGFRISNSQATLRDVAVVDSVEGFVVDAAGAGLLPGGLRQEGVDHDVITGGTVSSDAHWLRQGVPYHVTGDVAVQGPAGPTLAWQAGLQLELEAGRSLRVGDGVPGALQADGSAEAPISLRARADGATWGGISFLGQAKSSRLRHTRIAGVAPDAAVTVRSAPGQVELSHVKFANNASDVLVGCGSKPTLEGNEPAGGASVRQEAPCP